MECRRAILLCSGLHAGRGREVNTYFQALKEWGHGKKGRPCNALFRAANKARWRARTGAGAAQQGKPPPTAPKRNSRTPNETNGEEA